MHYFLSLVKFDIMLYILINFESSLLSLIHINIDLPNFLSNFEGYQVDLFDPVFHSLDGFFISEYSDYFLFCFWIICQRVWYTFPDDCMYNYHILKNGFFSLFLWIYFRHKMESLISHHWWSLFFSIYSSFHLSLTFPNNYFFLWYFPICMTKWISHSLHYQFDMVSFFLHLANLMWDKKTSRVSLIIFLNIMPQLLEFNYLVSLATLVLKFFY
jgi:hypothetical protein